MFAKKKFFKVLVIFLACAFVVSSVIPIAKRVQASSQKKDALKEHLTISIAFWQIADYFPPGKKDKVTEQIEKALNITIKPVAVTWSDYAEKYKVWAATNQLPDIFAHDGIGYRDIWKWQQEGVIRALPKDLSPYPNLKKYLSDEIMKFYYKDGKYWAIPRKQFEDVNKYQYGLCIYVHKDIYNSLKLKKKPETLEELKNMLRLIKKKYPNMVPLTSHNIYWMFGIIQNYNPGIGGWVYENGKWIPGFFSDKTLQGLKAMKPFWDEGLIDRDFAINKNTFNGRDKFILRKAAAIIHTVFPGHFIGNGYIQQWKKVYPNKNIADSIEILYMPKGPDGKYYIAKSTGFWSESYISANVDNKKMDRICRLYDYLLSQDGAMLRHYGIKNVDYKISQGKIIVTRPKEKDGSYVILTKIYPSLEMWQHLVHWDEDFPFNDVTIDPKIRKIGWDYINWRTKNCVPVPNYNPYLNLISTPLKDKFTYNIDEDDRVKLLMSKENLDKAWKTLKEKYIKQGLNQMIDEVNKEARKMGLIK